MNAVLDLGPWLKQAVLFAHVIAFAMTLSAVLREDLRWLLHRRIDTARLQRTMRSVTHGLVLLWMHAPKRPPTWFIVGAGLLVPAVIAVFLVHV